MFGSRVAAGQFRRAAVVATIAMLCLCARARGAEIEAPGTKVVDAYQAAAPAVVRVVVANEDLDENGKPRITRLAQSGFFISREGRVLTNAIASATRIWIEKDGLSYFAETVGSDPRTNVGLLQATRLPAQFGVIPLSAPDESLPIGSAVTAITSPLEFDPTPAPGFITGYESSFSDHIFVVSYMRMNIPSPDGSYGSPVIDAQGRLAGITIASLPQVNSTYAVTARALARIVDDLSTNGKVIYGTLPIEFTDGADKQNISRQVIVTSVVPNSTAARAGVRPGDIVRRLGTGKVSRMDDVRDALFFARVGKFIPIEIEREGRRLEFQLQVEARPDVPTSASAASPGPANGAGSGTTMTAPNPPASPTQAGKDTTGPNPAASPLPKTGGG